MSGGVEITHPLSKLKYVERYYGESFRVVGDSISLLLPADANIKEVLEKLNVSAEDVNVRKFEPFVSKYFFAQSITALAIAFGFMSIIVFYIYRKPLPCLYMVTAVIFDIVDTLFLLQLAGIELSLPVITGLLFLIGYSVDTDVLLTSRRLVYREDLKPIFKTGITMSVTTLAACLAMIALTSSCVIKAIGITLSAGIIFDIINTWLFNAVVLEWYIKG